MAKRTTKKKLTIRQQQEAEYRRYQKYWRELGQFADNFSRIESALQIALMQYCKISDDVRRAIFSGVRVNEGISLLRRLTDVGQIDPAECSGMKPLLDQISLINDRRNAILHHGAGSGTASNAFTALKPDRMTEYPISIPILRQMTDDLGLVFFLFCCSPDRASDASRLNSLAGISDVAWQYKPPSKQDRRRQGGKSVRRQHQRPSREP